MVLAYPRKEAVCARDIVGIEPTFERGVEQSRGSNMTCWRELESVRDREGEGVRELGGLGPAGVVTRMEWREACWFGAGFGQGGPRGRPSCLADGKGEPFMSVNVVHDDNVGSCCDAGTSGSV